MVRPEGDGDMHFTTNIGSFKLLGMMDSGVSGHLELNCTGTVLVSGFDKPPVTKGFRLEYTYEPLKKYAYHGKGTLVLDGKWRSVQWFGTGLTGYFHGRGKFRLVGEFDKDLNTGLYWMNDPKDKKYWPANSVMEVLVPAYSSQVSAPKAIPLPPTKPATAN